MYCEHVITLKGTGIQGTNSHWRCPLKNKLYIKLNNIQRKAVLFCCEYCVNFQSTYFEEHLRTAASEKEALIFYLFKILRF